MAPSETITPSHCFSPPPTPHLLLTVGIDSVSVHKGLSIHNNCSDTKAHQVLYSVKQINGLENRTKIQFSLHQGRQKQCVCGCVHVICVTD